MSHSEHPPIANEPKTKKRRRLGSSNVAKSSQAPKKSSNFTQEKLNKGFDSLTQTSLVSFPNGEAAETSHSDDIFKSDDSTQIKGRQTGVKKVQARISSLENTLQEVVPVIIELSKKYQSQEEAATVHEHSDTIPLESSQGNGINSYTATDSMYEVSLIVATSPTLSKRLFLEYDYSYHLIALYFTIHEYTGQEPIISRRDFFDSLPHNTIPTHLVHAMFAFSSRYSDHPLIFPKCLQFSQEFAHSSSLKACSLFCAPTIRSIQTLLLLSSLGIQRGNPSSSWSYLGSAIRASQILGLDSIDAEPRSLSVPLLNDYEAGALKRLWEICCSTDSEVSMLLDKPRQIKEAPLAPMMGKDISSLSPDQYVLSCLSVLPPYIVDCLKNTRIVLIYWKNIEELYSAQPDQSPRETCRQISNFGLVIDSWHLGLPHQLSYKPEYFHPQVAQRFPFLEQVINLHIIYYRLKLLLFQPILENHAEYQNCPGFSEAKQKYWQSACSLLKVLEDWHEWIGCSDGQLTLHAVCEIFNIPLLLAEPSSSGLVYQGANPPFLSTHFFFVGLSFLLSLNSAHTPADNPRRLKYSYSTLIELLTSTADWDGSLKVAEKLQELSASIGLSFPQ